MEKSRLWLSGFLLLGVLVGLPGSLLVAWQYHIDEAPPLIGLHFLALNAGYVVAALLSQRWQRACSPKTMALWACTIVFLGLSALFLAAPPAATAWRLGAMAMLGAGAGALGTAVLFGSETYFQRKRMAAVNAAAMWFGFGCVLATTVTAVNYVVGPARNTTAVLALAPIACFISFAQTPADTLARADADANRELLRHAVRDLRSIATVLFSLLLFFQFGNEWAIAGWLPLFLIHRFGCNPVWAIAILGLFFLALLGGRWLTQSKLLRLEHRRLLLASLALAMGGCFSLSLATSVITAAVAVAVIGAGFAPVYPLLAEQLDERFSFHPGFYNGAIAIAITGAMSVPWLLGFVDAWLGMRYVMLGPVLGSMIVLLLSLLLMLEAHLMREKAE